MKLASHYNRASIIITISVLLLGGILYYAAIREIATHQLDRDLTEEIDEIKDYINLHAQLPKQVDFDEDHTTFTKIGAKTLPRRYFDTLYYNDKEKYSGAGRAVEGYITFNGSNYKVIISESKESTEYLVQLILLITILLALVLLTVLIVTNRLVLNNLWKPFYKLLIQLRTFDIADDAVLAINETNVDEFEELNLAVLGMATKARSDFKHVKAFTENASHEMMTPLAVVTSKLDTLIQDEALNAGQLTQIINIYAYINKLSRLNQALLLLVKIDNNLINDEEQLDLKDILLEKSRQFQELMQGRNLEFHSHLQNNEIKASKYLVDILLNNLFSNAVRHSNGGGEIYLTLSGSQLVIANTGEQAPLVNELIFERFERGKHSEGTGMGLTLVKNICAHYRFNVKYEYVNNRHTFIITF